MSPRTTRARGAAGGLSEKAWQDQVVGLARAYGWREYHTHDSRRSNAGFPDLVLVRRPELVFAELKTNIGRVRPEQMEWITDLTVVGQAIQEGMTVESYAGATWPGVETFLWRPADFEHVHARLARGRRRMPVPAPDALGDW